MFYCLARPSIWTLYNNKGWMGSFGNGYWTLFLNVIFLMMDTAVEFGNRELKIYNAFILRHDADSPNVSLISPILL